MTRKYLALMIIATLVLIGCKRSSSEEKRKEIMEATGNAVTLCTETKSDMGETYTPNLSSNGLGLLYTFTRIADKIYCSSYSVSQFAHVVVMGSDITRLTVTYMAVEPHGLRTMEIHSEAGIFEFDVVVARSNPALVVAPRMSNDPVLLPPGIPR